MKIWKGFPMVILALLAGLVFFVSSAFASSTGTVRIRIYVPVLWSVKVDTPVPDRLTVLIKSNARQWEVILSCETEEAIQWRLAGSGDGFQEVTPDGVQILSGPAGDYSPGTEFELKKLTREPVECVVRWRSIYPDEQGEEDGAEGGEAIVILE